METGVDNFFAEVRGIGSLCINGRWTTPLFAAERFEIDQYYYDNFTYKDEELYSSSYEEYDEVQGLFDDEGVAAAYASAYGARWNDVIELMNFIFHENICDLHNGNIGFDKNMNPIIIDYAMC